MIKAVLFDLDNTLYNEDDYVKSGFRAVATYISSYTGIDESLVYQKLILDYENGLRKKNFDVLINDLKLKEIDVHVLIDIYRKHLPIIKLYDDAKECLSRLKMKRYKMGLVTQGNRESQINKIKALGLKNFFDAIYISEMESGITKENSTKPWEIILEKLKVSAKESIYVGDNPLQDIINPKKLGIKTIRIIRSSNFVYNLEFNQSIKADFIVDNLEKVVNIVRKL